MKSGQQGLPNQPGFPGQNPFQNQQTNFPVGFAPSGTSFVAPSFAGPFVQPPGQNNGFVSNGGFPLNSMPPPPAQLGYPSYPNQQGFSGFPQNQLFPQQPQIQQPQSSYPVSYQSQPFRPLIPGYAPAPSHVRRSDPIGQDQDEYRFYEHQIPQMGTINSSKHRKQH